MQIGTVFARQFASLSDVGSRLLETVLLIAIKDRLLHRSLAREGFRFFVEGTKVRLGGSAVCRIGDLCRDNYEI